MKKFGILNAQLAGYIAGLGHKERFLIGDAGMPVPKGIPVVDLVLCGGIPSFRQVVDAVLNETVIECYTFAKEAEGKNPEMVAYVRGKLEGIPGQTIPHDELKKQTETVKFAIRTGEFTPYSNLILQAGVAFPD
ncbi:D-ribose pyranase [Faecalispora anaeroviscerum]|uniref:D-ribose pyranase n=1 Tax=Faecalispora anaeroviscerum TaxID=2991836 RepID=UPI0024B93838|nr:D-ribose pyranase [Faecalispora anaeroviscerum]